MCPRKQPNYTSEDYLNEYLDKYARKRISGNHKEPPHLMVFYAKPKAPKTKHAWVSPYPLKLSEWGWNFPMHNINSIDLTTLIVFERELQRIDAMNKTASPNERARSINVIEHLTRRISEIENPTPQNWALFADLTGKINRVCLLRLIHPVSVYAR